jgi:hypothetical protein
LEAECKREYREFLRLALLAALGTIAHAQPLPPACIFPGPESCVYRSNINLPVGVTDLLLVDGAGSNYPVPIRVRYPMAPGPRPIVLWNHGGSPSPNGRECSEEWGMALAAAIAADDAAGDGDVDGMVDVGHAG